ncbi:MULTISPECIES: sugar phosphate isomerase/epimerase [unclassified Aureispira]|uniref:sugar phosphate isomerase/epimerase family protein n=1 Tax=unclassified Aureispira TaxID=2649989 RepID=UPI0006976D7E|nr:MULTISPECIES: TIM barrel protein [unclassified Aureispira]WMX16017.1 TIM barrel protein [Aureispira sp. CCB-E]
MNSNIYVSSLAFLGQPVEAVVKCCEKETINLEFSSGMPYRQDMELIYKACRFPRMPHNYFPAPQIPFVLNLASTDETIRRMSIEHCKNGLHLAKSSSSPFFAAHAGFCVDPNPAELGQKIKVPANLDKKLSKQHFLDSVNELLVLAEELDIDFLIENNVIAPFNYDNKVNFLLCTEYEEINWLFEMIEHDRLGLLLDTAHLKVSCQTLGLDLKQEFQKIKPFIKAFHHSDNDGTKDNNLPLPKDYWFLEYFDEFRNYVHVLEVKSLELFEIKAQIKLLTGDGN